MRWSLAAALAVAGFAVPVFCGTLPPEFVAAERALLEGTIGSLHDSKDPARTARESLNHLRGRLVEQGLEPALARAVGGDLPVLTPEDEKAFAGEDLTEAAKLEYSEERARHALRAAQRRLETWQRQSAESAPEVPADAAPRLRQIMRDPAFDPGTQRAGALEQRTEALRRFIMSFLLGIARVLTAHPAVLRVIVFAGLALALFVFLRLLIRRLSAPARLPHIEAGHAPAAGSHGPAAEALLARARAEIAAGRLAQGLALLQAAVVSALRARGLLPEEPGLTDRELLGALASGPDPALADEFRPLVSLHDHAVYAARAPEAGAVRAALEAAADLVGHRSAQAGTAS